MSSCHIYDVPGTILAKYSFHANIVFAPVNTQIYKQIYLPSDKQYYIGIVNLPWQLWRKLINYRKLEKSFSCTCLYSKILYEFVLFGYRTQVKQTYSIWIFLVIIFFMIWSVFFCWLSMILITLKKKNFVEIYFKQPYEKVII